MIEYRTYYICNNCQEEARVETTEADPDALARRPDLPAGWLAMNDEQLCAQCAGAVERALRQSASRLHDRVMAG